MTNSRLALKLLSVSAIVAAGVAGTSWQASATHRGGALTGTLNSATWRVCSSGLIVGQNATQHAITQVNRSQVSAYLVPCSASYNVSSHTAEYPDSWYGATSCANYTSSGKCSLKVVRLNARTIPSSGLWRMTACQEFGHVGGLGHRTGAGTCMHSPADATYENFDQHDIGALNATY